MLSLEPKLESTGGSRITPHYPHPPPLIHASLVRLHHEVPLGLVSQKHLDSSLDDIKHRDSLHVGVMLVTWSLSFHRQTKGEGRTGLS